MLIAIRLSWAGWRLVRVSGRCITISRISPVDDVGCTSDPLSVVHDNPDHIHLCRDLDMLAVHTIWLDLMVVRCDDIHLFRLDSAYSINSDLAVAEAEDRKLVTNRQALGIGDRVGQSRRGACMSLMRGGEEDLLMVEVLCMNGMDLMAEDEKLK